jgi:penicillin-binding protein-related factor A (putative recombinase)
MRHEQANRGKAFEESIIMVNENYKAREKAIITKVPTNESQYDRAGRLYLSAKV